MTSLAPSARAFRSRIEDHHAFLDTCDGGDPGTPGAPSTWLLGIEPGWSLADAKTNPVEDAQFASELKAYPVELQLKWSFNRNAFKLLSALGGGSPEDYRQFAMAARPFERGSTGYLKANLFPEPCNNVGEWDEISATNTGFATKDAYRAWLREKRFLVLTRRIADCRPRLVIGCGLGNLEDFLAITGTTERPPARIIEVNGHAKRIHVATSGTVPVAVIPHLSGGPHGLNSNAAIALAAAHIRAELGL